MKRVFRYNKSSYLLLVLLASILFIFLKGGFYEAFPVDNWVYSIIWITIILIIPIYLVIIGWLRINTKVETTSENISISNPYKSISLNWNEILEFGRIRKLGLNRVYWVFYIRGREIDARKIIVGTEDIHEVRALVATIIRKAVNAKLVSIQNATGFPFLSKKIITDWDRNEYLSEYLE